ncbi:hypothetical protein HAX54_039883, partial [Datura stramonium]|nr:hypothetical protein [Datura stramonium]
ICPDPSAGRCKYDGFSGAWVVCDGVWFGNLVFFRRWRFRPLVGAVVSAEGKREEEVRKRAAPLLVHGGATPVRFVGGGEEVEREIGCGCCCFGEGELRRR